MLTDPDAQMVLRPFLARELTASQAVAETGRDLNAVLYRLRQFVAAGLVRVVREVKRTGRPIKVYRSTHDAYFVPYEFTPFASLEERMLDQLLPHLRERVRSAARRLQEEGVSGQLLYRDESGETWMESAAESEGLADWLDPRRSVGLDFMTHVRLTDAEARRLQEALYETFERFVRGSASEVTPAQPGTRLYDFSVSLLPLDD